MGYASLWTSSVCQKSVLTFPRGQGDRLMPCPQCKSEKATVARNASAGALSDSNSSCVPLAKSTPNTGLERLRPSVAMTSNVKGREQLFLGLHHCFHLCA